MCVYIKREMPWCFYDVNDKVKCFAIFFHVSTTAKKIAKAHMCSYHTTPWHLICVVWTWQKRYFSWNCPYIKSLMILLFLSSEQVSHDSGWRCMDQPPTSWKSRAGAHSRPPHPGQRTHSHPRGQEKLLHLEVAKPLKLNTATSHVWVVNGLFTERWNNNPHTI